MQYRKQLGFTLLELLIVIVIIGILALLILPNLTSAPRKARDTQRKTDIAAIRKGLAEYFVDNDTYPAALSDLALGTAPIMQKVPNDPKNVAPFVYAYTPVAGNQAYSLTACLENDQDNGTDVIAPVSPCTTKTFQLTN